MSAMGVPEAFDEGVGQCTTARPGHVPSRGLGLVSLTYSVVNIEKLYRNVWHTVRAVITKVHRTTPYRPLHFSGRSRQYSLQRFMQEGDYGGGGGRAVYSGRGR